VDSRLGEDGLTSRPEQPERLDLRSHDIAGDKLAQLLELFPEARTEDGQIDFDQLRRALGEAVDPGKERYGLTWPGKAECFRTIQTPSLGTLLPAPDESVNWDTTENLIIEGDNLEVLKLLQKSYLGKVKMIYIDPPYNTGNDFIYPDDYGESLKTYLEYTGQLDEEGRKFSTNTDTDGRFHSKWLNMMYPRLYLARSLLRDDGVIFISIDDGEVRNLRALCDDIFGEENFFAQLPWQSRTSVQNDTDLSVQHEYLVAYARHRRVEHRRLKDANAHIWHTLPSFAAYPKPLDPSRYANPDNDPRGAWKADPFDAPNVRPNLTYPIVNPNTGEEHWPPQGRCWRTDAATYSSLLGDNRIVFGAAGKSRPQLKVFYTEKDQFGEVPTSWLDGASYGTATSGTEELQGLFGGSSPFTFPKPSSLMRALSRLATRENDLVFDFFAGSGSLAHGVLDLNAQDGGNRKFILVQLPEPTERDDYPTIADITKERVRRVIAKLKEEKGEADGQDRGFRVFKLAESNFSVWDAQGSRQLDAFEEQLRLHVNNVRDDRNADDVLFELLLKSGYPLSATIEPLEIAGKRVFSVADGALLVCLDRGLSLDLMRAVAEQKPERFVVLDEGFAGNDQLKANAVQIFKAADVTFRTV
jgi:adenine-specific DNA-methyltransferase